MSNDVTMRQLIDGIDAVRDTLMDEARGPAMDRLAKRGSLSARTRLDRLLDKDSFTEIGGLVSAEEQTTAPPPARTLSPADGVVVGTGLIAGRPVVVFSQDFAVFGGSIGRLGSAKIQRALQLAITRGMPLVMILDGGGHRIQDGQDARHFANANATFHNFARASGWVPMVALMLGAGFAGPTNYAGMADLVVMVRGSSTMGIADLGVASEDEAFEATRRFLSYLPGNARASAPVVEHPPVGRMADTVLDLVPVSTRKAYDVRKVLRLIADENSYFELKPTFAANMVTALARLGGRPVGIIANQPLRLGGMINADACDKGAHFIALCDAFGLPIVSFIDVPGFSIGSSAERTSLGRRSAKLVFEWGHATVPRVSIVVRKGYGLGYFAMCGGRSFSADACLAWPSAEICAMSIEGAIDVAFRKEYERAADPQARRREMIEETRAKIGALRAAEGFGIDDIIDPRDTRHRLVDIFANTLPRRPQDHPPKYRSIAPI